MKYFEYKDSNHITCKLCKHYCTLKQNGHGICGVNFNENQNLINTTYAHPSAVHLDPIEKKPLYHFLPTTTSLSIGTVGCNFRCPFCQNYSISQISHVNTSKTLTPKDAVILAKQYGAKSISYTYNEPTIWYPYAKDIGVLAKKEGLKNIFVSNGYESKEVLEDMKEWLDGANIDLKSFSSSYYKKTLKGSLDGVLETLKFIAKTDIHLEITTLLIPNVNDSKDELTEMAKWVAQNLGNKVPWHFSAFHGAYKMQDTKRTPLESLQMAKAIAKSYDIEYVYIGNVRNDNSTYCPKCNALLIKRDGFNTSIIGMKDSTCKECGYKIAGVFL